MGQRHHLDGEGVARRFGWMGVFIEQQVVARPHTLIGINVKSFHESKLVTAEELTKSALHGKHQWSFFRHHSESDAIAGYQVIQVSLRM